MWFDAWRRWRQGWDVGRVEQRPKEEGEHGGGARRVKLMHGDKAEEMGQPGHGYVELEGWRLCVGGEKKRCDLFRGARERRREGKRGELPLILDGFMGL